MFNLNSQSVFNEMSTNTTKILAFEYLVYRLIEWYNTAISSHATIIPPNFSRLTVLKLLFLTATVKNEEIEDVNKKDLLGLFNNFCAMQYGPVEIDIYTAIVKGHTKYYKLDNNSIEISQIQDDSFDSLESSLRNSIDVAISLLSTKNYNLIQYNSTQLVNITHKWQSWQNAMWIANVSGNRQEPMPTDSIRQDTPYYG